MKALSLKQPWAELILQGKKIIELRKWNTHFRGRFFIHSSKVPDLEGMKRFGFDELPNGFILGKANLGGVKKYFDDEEFEKDNDKHLAETEEWGRYGFLLDDVKRINPIPAKGKLNFWDFKEGVK
ncbi:MAG: ASCH domain-containing protein [Nanoarchaeota archaeon]|nr:ASCH domain-containing protein [Nanoarchaeota archaeon]